MKYKVITFYKFKELEDLENLRDKIRNFCKENQIFGRILFGKEGINAGVASSEKSIENFKKFIEKNCKVGKLTYRELNTNFNPYPKLQVKIRKEIVALGKKVDVKKTGNYLEPKQLVELYKKEKDFVIIDTRNDYESEIGKFQGAITPQIETFKEFPRWIEKQKHLKDKKVVIYCTGGIRCEKAGAYMKKIGFKDVNQIKGGVINFCQQYPKKYWEGSLFVFDNRLTSDMRSENPIAKCRLCKEPTFHSTNCSNVECNRIFPCCENCLEKFQNCCCAQCMKAERKREIPNVFMR